MKKFETGKASGYELSSVSNFDIRICFDPGAPGEIRYSNFVLEFPEP
jgi:hypothetical protein